MNIGIHSPLSQLRFEASGKVEKEARIFRRLCWRSCLSWRDLIRVYISGEGPCLRKLPGR